MEKKRISVIIPVYNCKRYISRCLDSLQSQTYPEVEIIIVDDGSTDGSGKICDEYATAHKNICVIHQKNGGPGLARNTGLSFVSGEYFTFVDGDDYVSKYYLERMSELSEKYDADIVEIGNVYLQPTRTDFSKCEEELLIMNGSNSLMKDYFSDMPKLRNTVWGRLYRSDKLASIQFEEHSIGEDYEYARSIFASSNRLVKSKQYLYAYRCYQASITRTNFNRKNFDVIDIDYNNLLFLEKSKDLEDCWRTQIVHFEHTCLEVLKKIALERAESYYPEEVEKLKVIYANVMDIAEKRNIEKNEEVAYALDNLSSWAEEYRRSMRKSVGIRMCKKTLYQVAAIFKNIIMYEYKFDD